jgi:5-methyltetrahydropteroyltriglutamate--homocysteine methyltransferase
MTTHVGSLIRPAEIQLDTLAHERGETYADKDAYLAALTSATRDVLLGQAATGIDVINDGEYGKSSWIRYIFGRVTGIEPRPVDFNSDQILSALPPGLLDTVPKLPQEVTRTGVEGFNPYRDAISRFVPFWSHDCSTSGQGLCWYCTGPITYDPTEIDEQLAILNQALVGVDVTGVFVTAISPASIYYMVDEYYNNDEDFVRAISAALREEYRKIIDAGFDLQVDDAVMWHKYSTIAMGGGTPADYGAWANLRIDGLNYALEGIPRDRIRYHICSGSAHGPKVFDPTLREILPYVLRVNWGKLLFEQGNVVHEHEWDVWQDFPLDDDRVLVPGVVTHQTEMVEHPELVAQRLIRTARIVGRDRVMAGTDCGFAQSVMMRRVDPWTQWAKLGSLVEGARLATEQLWK